MRYIATFDVGTTAVKGVLVNDEGHMVVSDSINIPTIFNNDFKEQNPDVWYDSFCEISRRFTKVYGARNIIGIVMSGQMQDLIALDYNLQPVCNAILYSDGRAVHEANQTEAMVGYEYLKRVTGNNYDGSLTFPKILWIKEHMPEVFDKIFKVLISSKDYIIAQLTGQCCGDVTACSTAGAMDIRNKVWDEYLIKKMGLSIELFPKLYFSHEKVGEVTAGAALKTDYNKGTPVYAGVGDAGATTLASGISDLGEYNINLGTSGWVAAISSDVLNITDGVFNLAAMPQNKYINVVPFLNAGNVHKWVSGIFTSYAKRIQGKIDYDYVTELLKLSKPGCKGVMFLPYLAGERFPVMDINVKGGFVGITPETKPEDMIRACLEGVAFSIRQGIEGIGQKAKKISVIGGGAREDIWCQILADVLGEDTYVYKDSEVLPSLAIASAVLLANGMINDYSEFTRSLQDDEKCMIYHPIQANAEIYANIYVKYLHLYPTIKAFYQL